jgi:hypothetical protein
MGATLPAAADADAISTPCIDPRCGNAMQQNGAPIHFWALIKNHFRQECRYRSSEPVPGWFRIRWMVDSQNHFHQERHHQSWVRVRASLRMPQMEYLEFVRKDHPGKDHFRQGCSQLSNLTLNYFRHKLKA